MKKTPQNLCSYYKQDFWLNTVAVIIALVGLIVLSSIPCHAEDGDVPYVEIKPDVASWSLDTIKLLRYTETAIITYRKVDSNGDSLGEEFDVIFMNVKDNPGTPGDETSTEFSDFYNYLHTRIIAGDSLKMAVTKAVKIKLEI